MPRCRVVRVADALEILHVCDCGALRPMNAPSTEALTTQRGQSRRIVLNPLAESISAVTDLLDRFHLERYFIRSLICFRSRWFLVRPVEMQPRFGLAQTDGQRHRSCGLL